MLFCLSQLQAVKENTVHARLAIHSFLPKEELFDGDRKLLPSCPTILYIKMALYQQHHSDLYIIVIGGPELPLLTAQALPGRRRRDEYFLFHPVQYVEEPVGTLNRPACKLCIM